MWDTGSSKLVVETQNCSNCISNVFDTRKSSSFSQYWPKVQTVVRYEDGTKLEGYFASDKVCPTANEKSCSDGFSFLALESQSGLQSNYDGIIGMWSGADGNTGGLLVPHLHRQGIIERSTFSVYLTSIPGESYIDFGEPNLAAMSNPGAVVWLDVLNEDGNESWWTNKINGIKWGDTDDAAFALTERKAFTDTGTSCLIGPSLEIGYLTQHIVDHLQYYEEDPNWGIVFNCRDREYLPTFELLYGHHWFQVRPDDYAVEVSKSGKCSLCFQERRTNDHWILGSAFMRGLYTIHDYEKLQMGFVPFAGSQKKVPTYEPVLPKTTLLKHLSDAKKSTEEAEEILGLKPAAFWTIVGSLTAAVLGTIIFLVL